MRKSLEIIRPFFHDFSSRDSRLPSHLLGKLDKLSAEMSFYIKEQISNEDNTGLVQSIQDLVAVSYNNGLKDAKKNLDKGSPEKQKLQGKIIHVTRDFRD